MGKVFDAFKEAFKVSCGIYPETNENMKIGGFEFKSGTLSESVTDAGGDDVLYTLDELRSFIKDNNDKSNAMQKDLAYAEGVMARFDRTNDKDLGL